MTNRHLKFSNRQLEITNRHLEFSNRQLEMTNRHLKFMNRQLEIINRQLKITIWQPVDRLSENKKFYRKTGEYKIRPYQMQRDQPL